MDHASLPSMVDSRAGLSGKPGVAVSVSPTLAHAADNTAMELSSQGLAGRGAACCRGAQSSQPARSQHEVPRAWAVPGKGPCVHGGPSTAAAPGQDSQASHTSTCVLGVLLMAVQGMAARWSYRGLLPRTESACRHGPCVQVWLAGWLAATGSAGNQWRMQVCICSGCMAQDAAGRHC